MEGDEYNEENWMDILLDLYKPDKNKPSAGKSGNRPTN